MSLEHHIFSLTQEQQDEAIRALARKTTTREEFDRWTRPLLHAKHRAGMSKPDCRALRQHFRTLYHEVKPG